MAENLDAEWYRQALRLVLSELEDLDTAHPVDIGYRIGELKVHLRNLIGESGQPPMVGLRGLEDLARSGRSGWGRPPHNGKSVRLLTSGNAAGAGSCDLPVEPGDREGREALTHWAELLGG